jgi:hypothetical protein
MAKADLTDLSDPDEIALAWSKFLVEDLVEQREAKTRAITASVYTFELEDGVPCLPTLGEEFSPDHPASAMKILTQNPNSYAYLAVLPGLPLSKEEASELNCEPTGRKQRKLVLGIPPEIIDPGEFPWFLMAVFVSPSLQMTFCGAFDGDKFNTVRLIHGSYGGFLSNLLPTFH